MKFNFRKVASVLASVVMLGSTVGIAAAANYPAPFVQSSGVASVGVVVGANAAYSDWAAAVDISQNLQLELAKVTAVGGTTGSTDEATGGDSYKIEKTSTKFQLGQGIIDVVSGTVTNDDLPTLLADGTYMDNDNNEFDFTQKIVLANSSVTMFDDNDYKADTPTVGMKVASGAQILNYTLEFTKNPSWADLETTDITIMGKKYYVLNAVTNTSLTLLDSATSETIAQGETKTITLDGKTYTVTISYVGDNKVKLKVNDQITNQLTSTTNTYKLTDGTYVGIREINYDAKETGISNVEFSLGKGKLYLQDGVTDIELNDEAISNLASDFVSSSEALQKIIIQWKADDDMFAADGSDIAMPGFGAVKLTWGGMTFPASETILVQPDGGNSVVLSNFPLKTSTEDINLIYWNGTQFTDVGKDSTHKLRTSSTGVGNTLTFDADTDDYFVASWTDGSDAESYLMRATTFAVEDGINKTTVQYRSDGSWVDAKAKAKETDTINVGSVSLTVGQVDKNDKTVVITAGSGVNFNTLYSKEGMKVFLPFANSTTSLAGALNTSYSGWANVTAGTMRTGWNTFSLIFSEEDKNENIASGKNITVTLAGNSDSKTTVSAVTPGVGGTSTEMGSSEIFRNFVYSALATEIQYDSGGDQDKVTLTYHGAESFANVRLNAPDVVITPAANGTSPGSVSSLGSITVTDAESSKVASSNLIVVGGNCVNTVAAKLLGGRGDVCLTEFTTKTGASAGSYVIQSFANPDAAAKVAVLVAGYDAADTVNAAKWLTTGKPDVAVGKKYKGTTATSATAIVA